MSKTKMFFIYSLLLLLNVIYPETLFAQQIDTLEKPVKVLHAEPLYIDLIRDLGASKGEREWNLGLGPTGPYIIHHFNDNTFRSSWQHNSSVHYMISGTKNLLGVEFNKEFSASNFDMTTRPQLRHAIADNLLLGIVTGIPISRTNERFSSFLRLLYEPKHT